MVEQRIPTTIVNHVALAMAVSPDIVWQIILADYLEAGKFRAMGYAVEPLDDVGVPIRNYRLRLAAPEGPDERLLSITECDAVARRLSLFSDYLSEPGGLQVYATYHAQEFGDGTLYRLDCHTRQTTLADTDDLAAVAAAITAIEADYRDYLIEYLESVRDLAASMA